MKALRTFLKGFRAVRLSLSMKFVIGVAVVLVITMAGSLFFIDAYHRKLVLEQIDQQARALFRQIVLTRKWIADHGGIFVEKTVEAEPNPYMPDPEIMDMSGRKYVRQSPAMVTKELSRYAREKGLYWFNITSLRLINPANAPDEFERTALTAFESGSVQELTRVEQIESGHFYRYIAPLYIEKPCLPCHSHQGYKIGDVRGAISVTIPMDRAREMIGAGRKGLVLLSGATIGMLMLVLYIMMKELVLRPVHRLKSSIDEFSRGRQSSTAIIRTGDELEVLGDSFVEMSRTLTAYHADLETRVKEATASLERANRRLTELNEKKSDFIAKISHELRTPMTSIRGAMDYLSAKVPAITGNSVERGDIMEFLEVIRKNADRLIRMVNDCLDLERIESGMFDLHCTNVDLLSLIKEVAVSFHSLTDQRNITFRIKASPRVLVHADPDRIGQVLINLISNSINFSPDNAEIDITVTETADHVSVMLRDEGPGIPGDVREKVFDKFYTMGRRPGTGLGLAISKGIIEAHGGTIEVMDGVSRGGAICFTLTKKGCLTGQETCPG